MTDNELILTISELMDKKLSPINNRLQKVEGKIDIVEKHMDSLETSLNGRMDDLGGRMDNLEGRMDNLEGRMDNLEGRIDDLETSVNERFDAVDKRFTQNEELLRRVSLIQETEILPRLQNIEDCYLSTYKRYQKSAEQTDAMQVDLDIMKKVLIEHSQKLQQIS